MKSFFQRACLRVRSFGFLLTLIVLSACAQIPDQMQIDTGNDPFNADKDVRFRTTYYFRVYDYCYDADTTTALRPQTDSLYRFVMTGKANAYANKVRFESGTLLASEIDPFGATIERDDETNRVRFVSQKEVEDTAIRNQGFAEIDRLLDLRARLAKMSGANGEQAVNSDVTVVIDQKIKEILDAGVFVGRARDTGNDSSSGSSEASSAENCPPGTQTQRGFQIMGPQGVKTYNQEDRLIMAMTSDASPLIASLEEVSGRMLKAEEKKFSSDAALLALIKEQLRVSELNGMVLSAGDDFKPKDLVKEIQTRLVEGDDQDALEAAKAKLPDPAPPTPNPVSAPAPAPAPAPNSTPAPNPSPAPAPIPVPAPSVETPTEAEGS